MNYTCATREEAADHAARSRFVSLHPLETCCVFYRSSNLRLCGRPSPVRTIAGTNGTCRASAPDAASNQGMMHMNDNDTTLIPGKDTPPPADMLLRIADHERGRTTVPGVLQSVGRTREFAAGGERGQMRAADADRDRVVEFLSTAYCEGRLSKDEYDGRLENALSARTYADLDQLVIDLPAARATTVTTPVARTNGLAIASVACGLALFVFGPLTAVPAIVFGHAARHQIKRTGEQGAGLAVAGLILGWATVILGIVLIVVGLATSVGMHGTMH